MAKPPVVEDVDFRHAMKVAAVTGQTPDRDVALLALLYGTGKTATELALLEVADVLNVDGTFRKKSKVRAAISWNNKDRPLFWVNKTVCETLERYFDARVAAGHGVTRWRSQWRGLAPLGPVFLTTDGRPFTLTTKVTKVGNKLRSCETLSEVIRKLHAQAGIEGAGSTSGRRTFAVRLHRAGLDLRHIREVTGLATLSGAKALAGTDPVSLGKIVAKVI